MMYQNNYFWSYRRTTVSISFTELQFFLLSLVSLLNHKGLLVSSFAVLPVSIRFSLQNNNNNNNIIFQRMTLKIQELEWQTLDPESLVSAKCLIEQTLCQPTDTLPQLAKDYDYASAVLEAWKEEEMNDTNNVWNTEWTSLTYYSSNNDNENNNNKNENANDSNKTPLYGHLIRKVPTEETQVNSTTQKNVVLLFHTGAGPHDLFLLWKAASLLNNNNINNNDNVPIRIDYVFIADILSDDIGWAWSSDRTKYNQQRQYILDTFWNGSTRPILQSRIAAAIETIHAITNNNNDDNDNSLTKIATLGWCLGGHAILELSKMSQYYNTICAMATFHGVFDTRAAISKQKEINDDNNNNYQQQQQSLSEKNDDNNCEVLICHGMEDPFVTNEQLEHAIETFQNCGHIVTLLQLKNAKHGFTNPAQDFNGNPAFGYHDESATKAWRQALALLMRRFSYNKEET